MSCIKYVYDNNNKASGGVFSGRPLVQWPTSPLHSGPSRGPREKTSKINNTCFKKKLQLKHINFNVLNLLNWPIKNNNATVKPDLC